MTLIAAPPHRMGEIAAERSILKPLFRFEESMSLTVRLDLPADIEKKLHQEGSHLDKEVKEAYVLELFRRGRLSHYELSRVLGIDRPETDAYLKRHNVLEGSLTMDDLDADLQTLRKLIS